MRPPEPGLAAAPRRSDAVAADPAAEAARIADVYARRTATSRYSWLEPAYVLHVHDAERAMLRALGDAGVTSLAGSRVLEVGCGRGHWLRALVQWGADPDLITGVDLLPDRLADAARLTAPGVRLVHGSATDLALPDATYDVVLQSTMFTSILDAALRQRAAREMLRVLRPGGLVLWHDFAVDNPRNPDVRGVAAAEVRALFPGCRVALRRTTLAPPIARLVARRAFWLAEALAWLPPLRTHLTGVIRRV